MSETVLTSPIILDATGQDMLTKLDSIISAINPVAQGVSYDNAGTGMVANNVQSAITELKTGLVNTNSSLTNLVKTTSGSFTTNNDGVIALGIPNTALLVTCKITASGNYYLCIPYYESGVWYAKVMSSAGSLTPIANRELTISISYI